MERAEQRAVRHRRRETFGTAAAQYDRYRPNYPAPLLETLANRAGLGPGTAVLEVGCGTGQLTELLCARGCDVTAIDVSGPMIEAARRRLDAGLVSLCASSFEAFDATSRSFDLIVSADAMHWVDPDVRYAKSARVLRPGGWLAVIACEERYDEPFASALRGIWLARSEDGGAWAAAPEPTAAEIEGTGRFEPPIEETHVLPLALSPADVVGLEGTRATALSWAPPARVDFADELSGLLAGAASVPAARLVHLVMARSRSWRASSRALDPGSHGEDT